MLDGAMQSFPVIERPKRGFRSVALQALLQLGVSCHHDKNAYDVLSTLACAGYGSCMC